MKFGPWKKPKTCYWAIDGPERGKKTQEDRGDVTKKAIKVASTALFAEGGGGRREVVEGQNSEVFKKTRKVREENRVSWAYVRWAWSKSKCQIPWKVGFAIVQGGRYSATGV